MRKYKVLIAGAGIGGLTAAACLMKAGHEVEIYEQAPALAEVGAGIQVSANAQHVLRHIGLGDEVLRLGVKPGAYVFRLHDTGEVIQRFSLAEEHEKMHGAPYTQLHRADLHDMLAAKAREFDPGVVRLNSKIAGFAQSDGWRQNAEGSRMADTAWRRATPWSRRRRTEDPWCAARWRATCRRPTPATPRGASSCRLTGCRRTCSKP